MVVNCTLIRVKIKSKLTNLMKITRIEGYNGKYGPNPQRIREIYDDLFEFIKSDDELIIEIGEIGIL